MSERLLINRRHDPYTEFPIINNSYKILEENNNESKGESKDEKKHQDKKFGIFDYSLINAGNSGDDEYWYSSILEYFENCCDFSFLKVAFDGRRILIDDLDSILKKKTTIFASDIVYKTEFHRFTSRHYDVNGDIDEDDDDYRHYYHGDYRSRIDEIYYRLLKRQEKYILRGFQVVIIFDSLIADFDRLEKIFVKKYEQECSWAKRFMYSLTIGDNVKLARESLDSFRDFVKRGFIIFK